MVDVGEGIVLELLVLSLPQPRPQALARQGREPGAAHAQNQGTERAEHHLHSLGVYVCPVAVCHPHVHQIGHEKGHQQLEHALRRDEEDRQECELLVFSHVGKDS